MLADDDDNMYDTIEIEDLDYHAGSKTFYYPCPCGDKFAITMVWFNLDYFQAQIMRGEDIAQCPSCSLMIKVVYDIKYIENNFAI